MTEHMAMMREQMGAMHNMMGRGGMGPGTGRGKGSGTPPSDPSEMMQQRMDMIQQMMEHMMQEHEVMMKPAE